MATVVRCGQTSAWNVYSSSLQGTLILQVFIFFASSRGQTGPAQYQSSYEARLQRTLAALREAQP